MTRENTKRLYLAIVVGAGVAAILVATTRAQIDGRLAAAVTILLVIELSIRFRYVIALLAWPVTVTRIALLMAFWGGLINLAWWVPDTRRWAVAAAVLFAIGVAIEIHNYVTRQWHIGSEVFQRSLRNDILRGIASATIAAITILLVADWSLRWTPIFAGALVVADALRLTEMVVRHRRLHGASPVSQI